MEPVAHPLRYLTLRDYLRVLRRYRIAIALIAVIGAAAGYLDAKRQTPVYEATAFVGFQDPTQDLQLVGLGGNSFESPAQLAAESSETLTRRDIMEQVKRMLGTPLPIGSLAAALSSLVSTQSGLLDITAQSSNPAFAPALANAVAQVVTNQDNQRTQARFAAVASSTRRQIARNGSSSTARLLPNELIFYQDELARLDTLSKFASSAQIERRAEQPGAPVSPTTVRSTLIGLVLGLLLAIALAFFRDSMDRRLRNPRDVESYFRLPVIGHVRDPVMGRIAYTANGRGKDYQADREAFRIIRRNLESLDRDSPPRSVVVTSTVPEEGKTTVAGSLAFAMAAAGRRTLLIDCDLRRPALSARLGVEQVPGISDFLAGEATPQEILRTVEFGEPSSTNGKALTANGDSASVTLHKLVFIPSGSPTSRAAELLGSTRFEAFLEQVTAVYDAVILDSSPLLPVADTLEIIPHVEGVIVCARDLQTTRDQALAAKAALSRFPERPTAVVVTGIKPHREDYEMYTYAYSQG
jgi:Mrp family chromosome partitioning ATPase